jgi:hypothetical protein
VYRAVLVVFVAFAAACASPVAPQVAHRTAPLPTAHHEYTCTEAALGLERGSVDVRSPETTVLQVMRAHCVEDRWPDYAIECFANMRPGDLGHCAAQLADGPRDRLLAELVPGDLDATATFGETEAKRTVANAEAELASLEVNIAECDRFIGAVRDVLACEAMPIGSRAELALEAGDVWSLPTHDLPPNIAARMAAACTAQLAELEKLDSPCKP